MLLHSGGCWCWVRAAAAAAGPMQPSRVRKLGRFRPLASHSPKLQLCAEDMPAYFGASSPRLGCCLCVSTGIWWLLSPSMLMEFGCLAHACWLASIDDCSTSNDAKLRMALNELRRLDVWSPLLAVKKLAMPARVYSAVLRFSRGTVPSTSAKTRQSRQVIVSFSILAQRCPFLTLICPTWPAQLQAGKQAKGLQEKELHGLKATRITVPDLPYNEPRNLTIEEQLRFNHHLKEIKTVPWS